jgi:hypothetical protein
MSLTTEIEKINRGLSLMLVEFKLEHYSVIGS